jgi:arylsulfatase A-like enzyme
MFTHQQEDPIKDLPTIGDAFRAGGYITGGIGKVHVLGETKSNDLGFDERALRIFEPPWVQYRDIVGREAVYEYANYSEPERFQRDSYNCANEPVHLERRLMYDDIVVGLCIDFMTRHKDGPFFLWAGLEKPHPEWYAPAEYHAMYSPSDMPLPETCRFKLNPDVLPRTLTGWGTKTDGMSDDEIRGAIAAYYANVTYLDDNVGKLLNALDKLGIAENTVTVYTSDHGENLFDHGLEQKHCFYESASAIPLIIRRPGKIEGGQRRNNLANLIDLFPTLAGMTGIKVPDSLEGRSLIPALEGVPDDSKTATYSEYYMWGAPERMIRTGRYKYIETVGEISQLYDLENDPNELRNLAVEPGHESLAARLKKWVTAGWELPSPGYKCRPMF